MERLLWLLLLCGVAGGANWYYPQKYAPQVEAARRSVAEAERKNGDLSQEIAEKDRTIGALKQEVADLGPKVDAARADLMELGRKYAAMQADYEARLQGQAAKPQSVVPDIPSVAAPVVRAEAAPSPPPPTGKTPSDSDLKRIADLQADVAAAQQKLKEAENDLMRWDAGAWVSEDGVLHAPARKHATTTNAPAEINDARKRIRNDQAELAGLQGPGG